MPQQESRSSTRATVQADNALWGTIAAFCASLVGIGLARFAYTPLLPALIDAHWFEAARAAYLGAANLAGYLAGALLGRKIAARFTAAFTLRTMMLLASAAFIACAAPVSFLWFFVWRFLSGLAGGTLMVLAAPAVLPLVKPSRRGMAGGVIFMGIGIGIAASGTLVPLLLQQGLATAWIGLGLVSMALTAIAWQGWPREQTCHAAHHAQSPATASMRRHRPPSNGALRALYLEYALNAAGWVPHMIFLVAYVAHGLGLGLQTGAEYWVLFGIGATFGPLAAGLLADRIGFARALRFAFLLEGFGIVLPVFGWGNIWLAISSVAVGAFVTGTVPLVLGRIHELLAHHPSQQGPAWRTATVCFALFQAVAAYGMSFIFSHSGNDYDLLFIAGTCAIALALVIDLAVSARKNASEATAHR